MSSQCPFLFLPHWSSPVLHQLVTCTILLFYNTALDSFWHLVTLKSVSLVWGSSSWGRQSQGSDGPPLRFNLISHIRECAVFVSPKEHAGRREEPVSRNMFSTGWHPLGIRMVGNFLRPIPRGTLLTIWVWGLKTVPYIGLWPKSNKSPLLQKMEWNHSYLLLLLVTVACCPLVL